MPVPPAIAKFSFLLLSGAFLWLAAAKDGRKEHGVNDLRRKGNIRTFPFKVTIHCCTLILQKAYYQHRTFVLFNLLVVEPPKLGWMVVGQANGLREPGRK